MKYAFSQRSSYTPLRPDHRGGSWVGCQALTKCGRASSPVTPPRKTACCLRSDHGAAQWHRQHKKTSTHQHRCPSSRPTAFALRPAGSAAANIGACALRHGASHWHSGHGCEDQGRNFFAVCTLPRRAPSTARFHRVPSGPRAAQLCTLKVLTALRRAVDSSCPEAASSHRRLASSHSSAADFP